MATIIPFTIKRNRAAQPRPHGHTATIIMFPGVRYERGRSGEAVGRTVKTAAEAVRAGEVSPR